MRQGSFDFEWGSFLCAPVRSRVMRCRRSGHGESLPLPSLQSSASVVATQPPEGLIIPIVPISPCALARDCPHSLCPLSRFPYSFLVSLAPCAPLPLLPLRVMVIKALGLSIGCLRAPIELRIGSWIQTSHRRHGVEPNGSVPLWKRRGVRCDTGFTVLNPVRIRNPDRRGRAEVTRGYRDDQG